MHRPTRFTSYSIDASTHALRMAEHSLGLNRSTDPLDLLIEMEDDPTGELAFTLMNSPINLIHNR